MSKVPRASMLTLALAAGLALGCRTAAVATPVTTTAAAHPAEGALPSAEPIPRTWRLENRERAVLITLETASRELGLSRRQRERVAAIRDELTRRTAPVERAKAKLTAILAAGVAAGEVDVARANAAVAELTRAAAEARGAPASALNALHRALSSPQRHALAEAGRARFAEWGGREGIVEEPPGLQTLTGPRLDALEEELGLSRGQVETIREALRAEVEARIGDRIEDFSDAFAGDDFDARRLWDESLAVKVAEHEAARRVLFYEAVAPVLTSLQREKLSRRLSAEASSAR